MSMHRAGDFAGARRGYEALLQANPADDNVRYLLGTVELQLGNFDDAILHLGSAAERMPGFAPVYLNHGLALRGAGLEREALRAFAQATRAQPDHLGAWNNLGAIAFALHEWPQARDAFAHAATIDGAGDETLVNLGSAQLKLGEVAGAEESLRRAVELNPGNLGAWIQRASACMALGDFDKAAACLDRADALGHGGAEVLLQRGQLAERRGRRADAMDFYREALARAPDLPEANYSLGCLLWEDGDVAGSKQCFDRALRVRPDYADARWVRVMAELAIVRDDDQDDMGALRRFADGIEALDDWFRGDRVRDGWASVGTMQPYFIVYYASNHRSVLSRYGNLCARLMGAWQAGRPPGQAPAIVGRAKLRVGVVAAHLRKHSIWDAIVRGWFKAIDPARIDLVAYHLGEGEDAETDIARRRAVRYVHPVGAARARLETWVDEIGRDTPDVLLYPEIGLDGLSLQLAAMRLAPVQATTWGQPATSGLPTLDYFLSGSAFESDAADGHYSERLVRLPGLGVWYEALGVVPEAPDWDALGLDPSRPLLLCPGTPFKYAPTDDAMLVDIARRVPHVQLVFFNYEKQGLARKLRDRLLRAFQAARIHGTGNLRFIPWQPMQRYCGLLKGATAMLDTIGFSGFNTAMQAIEYGLPVVAWEGEFLRGRLASAPLRQMAIPGLVAQDAARYAEIAASLCLDVDYRNDTRAAIQSRREALFRDERPMRSLEEWLCTGNLVVAR